MVKELQKFLGFDNFYHRFIAQSQIPAPLTSLPRHKSLSWTPVNTEAFLQLSLLHCSCMLSFGSESPFHGRGWCFLLRSWCSIVTKEGWTPVLHPCGYFSKKLSSAEHNCDIRNRNLLAIKLALKEWWHWLESARHLFKVKTDHNKLQYRHDAKRLNPLQARCALFFTRFRFTVTYRPGHNLKSDALSRLYKPDQALEYPETILPPTVCLGLIEWDRDKSNPCLKIRNPRWTCSAGMSRREYFHNICSLP